MSKTIKFVILAVTKTFDKFCIAGMDENGKWIRPLPVGKVKFWPNVFYQNNDPIQVGDVWVINNYKQEFDLSSPGHTEDIRLDEDPIFEKHLSNDQLIQFVNKHQEDITDLRRTLNAESRSLCLVQVDNFRNSMEKSSYDGTTSPRIFFSFKGNKYGNSSRSTQGLPITDLKWRSYTIKNIGTPKKMTSAFICVGLARTEPTKGINIEYPMVISVITDPEVPMLPTYPK